MSYATPAVTMKYEMRTRVKTSIGEGYLISRPRREDNCADRAPRHKHCLALGGLSRALADPPRRVRSPEMRYGNAVQSCVLQWLQWRYGPDTDTHARTLTSPCVRSIPSADIVPPVLSLSTVAELIRCRTGALGCTTGAQWGVGQWVRDTSAVGSVSFELQTRCCQGLIRLAPAQCIRR